MERWESSDNSQGSLLQADEATPVWGSPSQQNCSVRNWGQGRGLERLSEHSGFIPTPWWEFYHVWEGAAVWGARVKKVVV